LFHADDGHAQPGSALPWVDALTDLPAAEQS